MHRLRPKIGVLGGLACAATLLLGAAPAMASTNNSANRSPALRSCTARCTARLPTPPHHASQRQTFRVLGGQSTGEFAGTALDVGLCSAKV